MLLLFAYLYSHRRSVILIDEPDAHLEILRQKQVYVLLREIATENQSQVIMVTHSDAAILGQVFAGRDRDFAVWKAAEEATGRLLWEARTERLRLSAFAEEFFRRLAARLGHAMLLRKGELYRLVDFLAVDRIPDEVAEKLDLLAELFAGARSEETGSAQAV